MSAAKEDYIRTIICGIGLLIFVYLGYWFFVSQNINRAIKTFVANAPQQGIVFGFEKPVLKGFPIIPTVYFSGELLVRGRPLIIPELKVSGMFIPGTLLKIKMRNGFAFGSDIPEITSADSLFIDIITPKSFPESNGLSDVRDWQRKVGFVDVSDFDLRKGDASISGSGTVGLDPGLQLKGTLKVKAEGHMDQLRSLSENKVISKQEYQIAATALLYLSTEAPITGAPVIEETLSIRDLRVFLGPVPVAPLPPLVWGTRNAPVLLPQ